MCNRLTIKGQVTIPKEVRDFLGLTTGKSAVEFVIDADGVVRVVKVQEVPQQGAVLPSRYCDRVLGLLAGTVV